MPKQENTAINNLVNVAAGRMESDPGENLFGEAPLFGERRPPHHAQQMAAQPPVTMRGAPPAAARAHAPQSARRAHPTSHGPAVAHAQRTMPAQAAQVPAYGPPTMPAQQMPASQRSRGYAAQPAPQPSRAYAAQPSRGFAAQQPASVESMQTIARSPQDASRDSLDGKPTISILPQHHRSGASPYAPTEPVRQLESSRGQVHPGARVPQPSVPVAPMPRRRAPAATPTQFPPERAPHAYAAAVAHAPTISAAAPSHAVPTLPSYVPAPNLGDPEELYATMPVERFAPPDPTALVHALPSPRSGPRPFLVELAHTLKEFAAPIGVLTVVAVFLGGYLAFDGQGGKKRSPAAVVSAPLAAAAKASPSLADAVIAADPSLGPIEHVAADAPLVPVPAPAPVVEPVPVAEPAPAAEPAPEQVAAASEDEAADEIEMDATQVSVSKKKRSARSRRAHAAVDVALAEDEAATKRRTVEKKPVETRSEKASAKRASKVAEGELPPNVADKTNGGPGKLVVSADVPALIYLDGRNTNLTAPKKITVPAGKHKVTLLDPETRKAKTQDIEIVAGKTVTVEKQFN